MVRILTICIAAVVIARVTISAIAASQGNATDGSAQNAGPTGPPRDSDAGSRSVSSQNTGRDGEFCDANSCGNEIYVGCKNVIVGAGWSGTYFAWRTTVDTTAKSKFSQTELDPKETCIFEASERVGGRAYSRENIPGLQDLRVDLGAYRWDRVNHPLVNHVMTAVMRYPTRCYDVPACSNYSMLSNIRDAYGNNYGYANGPEGLVQKFLEVGGRIFMNHTLVGIYEDGKDRVSLKLKRGSKDEAKSVTLGCDLAFLNIPTSSVRSLDEKSILFKNDTVKQLLHAPKEDIGAKLFLVYNSTPWRVYPELSVTNSEEFVGTKNNLFTDGVNSSLVELEGRFGDFYGKCPESAKLGLTCFGTVMVYYSFGDGTLPFQMLRKREDPYTYLKYDDNEELLNVAHKKFQNALVTRANESFSKMCSFAAENSSWWLTEEHYKRFFDADVAQRSFAGVLNDTDLDRVAYRECEFKPGFQLLERQLGSIAEMISPTGGVVATWKSTATTTNGKTVPGNVLYPGPSSFHNLANEAGRPNQIVYDPNHAVRNIISKPIQDRKIFIANEAYSSGNGWAHPALIMTERILHAHFSTGYPKWVTDECVACLTGSEDGKDCSHCISHDWWAMEIENHQELGPLYENCTCTGPNDQNCIKGNRREPSDPVHRRCFENPLSPFELPPSDCSQGNEVVRDGINVTWSWVDDFHVSITAAIRGLAWAGLGFGQSMANADIIIATCGTEGEADVSLYTSVGYVAPTILAPDDKFWIESLEPKFRCNETGLIVQPGLEPKYIFKFVLSIKRNVNISNELNALNPIPMIFAASTNPPEIIDGRGKKQFNLQIHDQKLPAFAPLFCGRREIVTFNQVRSMFRTKDVAAMKFSFDLSKAEDVQQNFDGILGVLEAKSIYGLATGMPPDITWSLKNIQQLIAWRDGGFLPGSSSGSGGQDCDAHPFYSDVCTLFRQKDVDAMKPRNLDLHDYNVVKREASNILAYVIAGTMPCDGPWGVDKINKFKNWIACGYPKGGGEACGMTATDMYYNMWHNKENSTIMARARVKMDSLLAEAHKAGSYPYGVQFVGDVPTDEETALINKAIEGYRYRQSFYYTPKAFLERMDLFYDQLNAQSILSDPILGDPTLNGTRETFIWERLQLAPFNLIDGAWLSDCCPSGPIDEVHALLWGILDDEMGNGNRNHNHCQLFQELLESIGIYLPPVDSYDFVYNSGIEPEAFTVSAYIMGLATWGSNAYFPELLGSTLQLETGAVGLPITINQLKYYGMNPHFYELHIGIDNAASGHCYRAKRATTLYLDQVERTHGHEEMQKTWQRIWDGFLAFDALGNLGDKMDDYIFDNTFLSPREAVIRMMQRKGIYGAKNHQTRRLGNKTINELFGDPELFITNLETSPWVVAGNPYKSPIMDYLTTFDGPMFKVFEPSELETWRNWIRELKPRGIQRANKLDVFGSMVELIKRVMKAGMAEIPHRSRNLCGPAPNTKSGDKVVCQSVAVWLDTVQESPLHIMRVLIDESNSLIVCGNAKESFFVNHLLEPSNKMGKMFSRVAAEAKDLKDPRFEPEQGFWTWTDIVKVWIDDGCPLEHKEGEGYSLFPTKDVTKKRRRRDHRVSVKGKGKKRIH